MDETKVCLECGTQLPPQPQGPGRKRHYCGDPCRKKAWKKTHYEGKTEREHQRACNQAYLRGFQESGGDVLSIRLGNLPYPQIVIRDNFGKSK